jgi:hypothetical protein
MAKFDSGSIILILVIIIVFLLVTNGMLTRCHTILADKLTETSVTDTSN